MKKLRGVMKRERTHYPFKKKSENFYYRCGMILFNIASHQVQILDSGITKYLLQYCLIIIYI
jgi:hypothetical protein